MAKPEAYGKTSPVSTCPICHDFMLPEEYDKHVMTEHTKDQRERHGVKVEEKPGSKDHFYGDVWSKYDEQQPYQFTQAEFDAITKDAWEADCEQCRSIIENTEMDGSEYAIHPTSEQKAHMTDLFGYSAERVQKPTGYLDPEDPQWQKSVEHIIQERQKKPGNIGTFGPQSGMRRGEPTRDEWQIASYLDSIGLEYIHKMKLGEIDPTVGKPKVEYDLFIPSLLIAIETSPGWHEGGPSELARVAENDKFKRKFAKENGIELFVYDPDEKFGSAEFINTVLAPELRTHGVDAPEVPAGELTGDIPIPPAKDEEEDLSTEGRTYGDPRFNEWDTPFIYREEDFELSHGRYKCPDCGQIFNNHYEFAKHYPSAHTDFSKETPQGAEGTLPRDLTVWYPRYVPEREVKRLEEEEDLSPENFDENLEATRTALANPIVSNVLSSLEKESMNTYLEGLEIAKEAGDWKMVNEIWGLVKGLLLQLAFSQPYSQGNKDLREAGYDWDYNTKYREKPILAEQNEPIGDSWKGKGKHNICTKCRKETELCDICNYHHHVDNFMGEHEKFQMIVNSGGLEWDKLPPQLQDFETKYGTAFPCPMDIDPEDIGTFQKEEQTDVPEGVVPPEGYARQTTEEAAIGVLDHLIKGGVESFESWDEVIEHLQFLVDTGYIANFQPPNISEEEFEVWKPLIQGMMRQQTRWPDLKEQSGIPQNIPTGAYTRLEPLTQDQSQNFPRFPERGKVNTIEQQSGGPELEAQNILKLEEEIKKLESQV